MPLTVIMTLENSYKDTLNAEVDKYLDAYLNPLVAYNPNTPIPEDLVQLLATEKTLSQKMAELKGVAISPLQFDALRNVESYYDSLESKNNDKRKALTEEADSKKKQMQADHDRRVVEAHEYNESLKAPIREKHEQLLQYKDTLLDVFKHYDITPLDMDISDDLTVDEFNTLIEESIKTCEKYKVKESGGLVEKVLAPLKGEKNFQFTICYAALILVALYFALPILSIPVFIMTSRAINGLHKDIEKLKIAMSLMSQVDYARFVSEEDIKVVEELDLKPVDDELADKLSDIKSYATERADAKKKLGECSAEISKICSEATSKVKVAYAEKIEAYAKQLSIVQEKVKNMMEDYHPFPTVQNNSVVMSHNYTLGRIENRLDVRVELPLQNIVFNDADRQSALNNMKLYLSNALLSVQVKQLTVEIFDPKNMGSDFVEFSTPELKPYISINKTRLEDILKVYKKYSQDNILELDNKDIDTFNRIAEEQEIVPREYKLLLLVSEFDKLEKGDEAELFKEYFKFSATSGVMIWMLSSKKHPNSIWVDGSYNADGTAIQYTKELGKEAVATYTKALANFKDRGIDYKTKFAEKYIPEDKWWTWDTIKGINVHFGLENGDPTRGLPMVIGDANVHALMGGATGAGKSAAINQFLISLLTMYPPSELQIVYIDFKNVEAAKFTQGYLLDEDKWMPLDMQKEKLKNEEYFSRFSRIPHLKIISGTTDGEYALSVFEFLMNEMSRRQRILNKAGKMKIEELRKDILSSYNKEHNTPKGTWRDMRQNWDWYKKNVVDVYGELPRLLILFDEFQVMFNTEFVEQKVIDMINGKITAITKLARAMGCHFFFTSQSMKGTMSKDTMGNFSLRGALRCDADVSTELLGNGAAGTIKQKFGFMYTNDSAGQNKDANKLWRVPYLDEKDIAPYVDKLNDMLESHNEEHLMAEFYDEKVLVPATEIQKWYKNYPDSFNDPRVFILGERADYSENKAPITVRLMDDTGENFIIAAFEREDMLNLTMTMIDNIKAKENATLIVNCQDKDTYTLLDLETIADPRFVSLASPKQDVKEFASAIDAMITARESAEGELNPVYIVCIQWERAPYLSVDINYGFQDTFKDLLRRAPSVGVHFIFACKEKLDLPRPVANACNHKIGGLLTDKDSFFFINTPKVNKLPKRDDDKGLFAIYEYGNTLHKFRIYQHVYTKQLASREVVI